MNENSNTTLVFNTISFPNFTWKCFILEKEEKKVAIIILFIKSNRKCELIIFKLTLQKCFLNRLKTLVPNS